MPFEERQHAILRSSSRLGVSLHRMDATLVTRGVIRSLHGQIEGVVRIRINLQLNDGFSRGFTGTSMGGDAPVCRCPIVLGAGQNQHRTIQSVGPGRLAPGIIGDQRGVSAPAALGAMIDEMSLRQAQSGSAAQRETDQADAVTVDERQRCQMIECGVRVAYLHGIV